MEVKSRSVSEQGDELRRDLLPTTLILIKIHENVSAA